MAWTGSASHEDGSKLLSQESTAVLKLLGMFLTAMSPLLLLPLFLTDARGRRWVGDRTGLSIFVVGVSIILAFLTTVNWDLVAPYAETSFVTLQSAFNVAKQLPGDLVDWLQSGEGFYLLLKVFAAFAVIALFCARVLPTLQKGLSSLKAQLKGKDINLEPRSVNSLRQREEIAASRERQQQELREKAREKDELLRQRRLARATEEEQRLSRKFGRGVGRYAR